MGGGVEGRKYKHKMDIGAEKGNGKTVLEQDAAEHAWPPAGGVANQLGPQHTDRCVYKEGRHTHIKLLGEYLGSDCLRGIPYLPGSTRKSPNTKDGCSCTVTEKLSFR